MSKKPTSVRQAKKQAKKRAKLQKIAQQAQNVKRKKDNVEITLHEAYEILGGFTHTFSKVKYAKALEMVMAVDPEFAKTLDALNSAGKSFKTATSEDIATAEEVVRNAQFINEAYSDNKLFDEVMDNPEIVEAFENTPLFEPITTDEYQRTTFATAQNIVIPEIVNDKEFSEAESTKKKTMLVSRLRNAIKRTLFRARLSSLSKSVQSFRQAFDFKNKVKISTKSIAGLFEKSYNKVNKFIKDLTKKGKTKAAVWLNKAKTRVHSSMVKVAAASVLFSSFLPSCKENSSQAYQPAPAVQKTAVMPDTLKTVRPVVSDSIPSDTISIADSIPQATFVADSLFVPTEWNDSIGVSSGSWKVNQTFFGDRADYEKAYKKITNEMLEKSGFDNRDQFLNAYRVLRSYYPNVIENQGDVLAERTETSEKFSKFFNNDDCVNADEFTDEDFTILQQALSLTGTLNRRSTQELRGDEPCDPGKVQYTKIETQQETQANPVEILSDGFDEYGQSTVIGDSIPEFEGFVETGSSRVVTEASADTTTLNLNVFRGNDLSDGQLIGTMNAEDVVGKKTTNKKILVEGTLADSVATVDSQLTFDEIGSSRVDSVAVADSQLTFDEIGSSRVDSVAIADSQLTFDEIGSSRVDSVAVADSQLTFDEIGSSRVDSVAVADSQLTFDEIGSSITIDANIEGTDSIQVVEDSAELPIGTPAAGYVSERGGVNNCGLTAEQLEYSKSKITDRYGETAYEDLMSGISDDMLAKGNVFEGLTREQAIYNLSVWSVVYPYSSETNLIYDYVLNCHQGETMSADDAAKAKAAMDRIRVNKTIDDVIYNKPIYVKSVKNMGCDEKVLVNAEHLSGNVSPTHPSGPKFPRLFGLRISRPDPIITATSFDEYGTSRVETEYVFVPKAPSIQKYKGNDLDISTSQYIGDIDAADIVNATVTNKENILVEGRISTSTAEPSTAKPKDKKDKKAKKADEKKGKFSYDNLTDEQKAARLEAARETVRQWRSR